MSIDLFLWPLTALPAGTRPTISDGFKATAIEGVRRRHLGVDVMYPRNPPGTASPPDLTRNFACPSGRSPVIAAGPGKVFSVDRVDPHGIMVELDHGQVAGFGPGVTVYRHLATIAVKQGDPVVAGTFLGFAGHDLAAGATSPNHLHFELWDTSRVRGPLTRRQAFSIDPEPFMHRWKVKTPSGFTSPDSSPAGEEDAGEDDFDLPNVTTLVLLDLGAIHGGLL